jgi:two-component system response regulator
MTPPTSTSESLRVLIAEDSEFDRSLLRDAFSELGFNVLLIFVGNGEELLEYLRGPDSLKAGLPSLILMDLNMPRMKGLDALKALRADALLRALPVIILSTSNNPKQIAESYESGVNAYMTKPSQFGELLDNVQKFGEFWLKVSELPDPSLLAPRSTKQGPDLAK